MVEDTMLRQSPSQSSPLPRPPQNSVSPESRCSDGNGRLPDACSPLAFPYVPMQCNDPQRYNNSQALQRGTLFPGLDLPFHRELKTRFPAVNQALSVSFGLIG